MKTAETALGESLLEYSVNSNPHGREPTYVFEIRLSVTKSAGLDGIQSSSRYR